MASLNIPYSFVNGTTADASQVNANFSAVKSFVESQLVTPDGSVKATSSSYTAGSVGTAALAADAVTAEKMADASVELNTATVTGTLTVAKGGTGGTTAVEAITNIKAYGKGVEAAGGYRIIITSLSGTTVPASGTGSVGDLYVDTSGKKVYGPKTAEGWGTGSNLVNGDIWIKP